MQSRFKHTTLGYFNFFYQAMGYKFIFNILLGLIVSLLDGLGIAMFIPLLQYVNTDSSKKVDTESLGALNYVIRVFEKMNIPLTVYSVLAVMVLLFFVKGLISFWQLYSQVHLKRKYMKQMRYKLINGLQNLSYKGFLTMDAGKIQNNLTSEVSKLLTSVSLYLGASRSIVMLATYILLAFLANWKFALFVGAGAFLTNLLFKKVFADVKKSSYSISLKGNAYYSYLNQSVQYFKYLKATNHFPDFSFKIKKVVNEIEDLNKRIGFNHSLTSALREPLIVVIVVIVIIVQISWFGSTLGSILLSILLFYRALGFLMGIQTIWQGFMQNVGSIAAVDGLLSEMEASVELTNDDPIPPIQKGLQFNNIKFSYGTKKVIDNITLSIPKNSTIAFVGESGSGKSTMVNIISAIINVDEGSFEVDGRPIGDFDLKSYRSKIGYISQEAVIFKDNIYNNITFWADRTPENLKRFWHVVELASLSDFINGLHERENTELGDNGMLVSGGQKQRISIARELFKKVEILILDEATSALDSETERAIQENIERLQGSYTMIIIAHRLSTIKNVDTVYLLDNGKIAAFGKFAELSERSERFKRMVSLQDFN